MYKMSKNSKRFKFACLVQLTAENSWNIMFKINSNSQKAAEHDIKEAWKIK